MEILEYFEKIISKKNNPTVIEIGGCEGMHTIILNDIIKKYTNLYTYHVFEPAPVFKKHYEKIISKYPKVKYHSKAVTDKVGVAKFHLSSQNYYGSSSLKVPTNCTKIWKDMSFSSIEVETTSLNFFMETNKIENIDFIWMDAQGAEKNVIIGANNFINKIDYIYAEYYGEKGGLYEDDTGYADIINILPGWSAVERWPGDILMKRNEVTY